MFSDRFVGTIFCKFMLFFCCCMVPVEAQPIMPPNKSPFRFPKCQELVIFRKLIEEGKNHEVEKIIRDNPRYLIGSGDTPSILKVRRKRERERKHLLVYKIY